jgi:membrane-bound lytic murein transglycosylase A
VLFTAYCSPSFEGSRARTEKFRFPLRRPPAELVQVDLGRFDPALTGRLLTGRLAGRELVPFWSRREIEGSGKLDGRGLEVAWFARRLDAFLLEVEGSGSLRLEDGSRVRLQTVATNGLPFTSPARELIKDGKIPAEKASTNALRAYFDAHPEEQDEYLFRNARYVFFDESKDPPRGCSGAFVTGGRSIATDKRVFPPGALAFVVVSLPVVEGGKVVRFEKRARFVLDDDTGGAIIGPGRVDLYMGDDEAAEIAAGCVKQPGELYYLLLRP